MVTSSNLVRSDRSDKLFYSFSVKHHDYNTPPSLFCASLMPSPGTSSPYTSCHLVFNLFILSSSAATMTSPNPPASNMMTLFCQLFGEAEAFPIEISGEKTVGVLKKFIHAENPNSFRGIDARTLQLWEWNRAEEVHDSELGSQNQLSVRKALNQVFKNGTPNPELVHIIIKAPSTCPVFTNYAYLLTVLSSLKLPLLVSETRIRFSPIFIFCLDIEMTDAPSRCGMIILTSIHSMCVVLGSDNLTPHGKE